MRKSIHRLPKETKFYSDKSKTHEERKRNSTAKKSSATKSKSVKRSKSPKKEDIPFSTAEEVKITDGSDEVTA